MQWPATAAEDIGTRVGLTIMDFILAGAEAPESADGMFLRRPLSTDLPSYGGWGHVTPRLSHGCGFNAEGMVGALELLSLAVTGDPRA